MKLNKRVKTLIIVSILVLIGLAVTVFAVNGSLEKSGEPRPMPKTVVFYEQQADDNSKVDVYLGMADESSISSFQVGIDVAIQDYDAEFEWSNESLKSGDNVLREVKYRGDKDETTSSEAERIDLFYVGEDELNTLNGNNDIDRIKLGTLNLKPQKENLETKDLIVVTVKDFTKTVSLAHTGSPVEVDYDNIQYPQKLKTTIKGVDPSAEPTEEPSTEPTEEPTTEPTTEPTEEPTTEPTEEPTTEPTQEPTEEPRENPTVENINTNVEGNKISVNFKLNDPSKSVTRLAVRLVDASGNQVAIRELDTNAGDKSAVFENVEPGNGYQVQILATYTSETGESISDGLLKTTDDQEAQVPGINVEPSENPTEEPTEEPGNEPTEQPGDIPTTEPSDNPSENPGDEPTQEPSNPTDEPGNSSDDNNNGGSTGGHNNGWSANDEDKANGSAGGNVVQQFFNAIKTGANKSVTWAIIAVIVLVAVAFGIIRLKKNNKNKNSKH